MKFEIEMPDDIAAELFASTRSRNISPAVYVSELVCQALANEQLGDSGKLENRSDWQSAIQEGREDIRASSRTRRSWSGTSATPNSLVAAALGFQ